MKQIRKTSSIVAETLISLAVLKDDCSILEPSAGEGDIVDIIRNNYTFSNLKIDCVELNKEKYEYLKNKGYTSYHIDFLNYNTLSTYDRIIAAPPFKNNIDLLHIKKMYGMLSKNGILVTLTAPYWITNNEEVHVEFRKWLQNKNYQITMLPDNSFMEKGKTVNVCILRIFK